MPSLLRACRYGLDGPCPIPTAEKACGGPTLQIRGWCAELGPLGCPGRGTRGGELRAPSVNGAPLPLEWGSGRGKGMVAPC